MPDSKDSSQSAKQQSADAHPAPKAHFHRLQQELQTPQLHARSHNGQKRQSSELLLSIQRSKQQRVTKRDLFRADKEQSQSSPASQTAQCSPTSAFHQLHAASPELARPPLVDANTELHSPVPMSQQALDQSLHSSPAACALPLLQGRSAEVLQSRLGRCDLLPAHTAAGRQLLEMEAQLQSLVGARKPVDDADEVCWVDNGLLLYPEGVKCFAICYGDAECAQMLQGLSQVVSRWRCSPNSHHCTDESHKSFQAKAASACLMRRLVALTRTRVQLMQQQSVLHATVSLVKALCMKFPEQMHAGLFTFELRPLLHQVLTIQRHWQSESGPQRADRAVFMLQAMTTKTAQLPGDGVLSLSDYIHQLLNQSHPQAELVQERLSRHIQHLLKFGRNTYDPLQYNAVVADIDHPLLINAGPGSGKTTVMALRALYIIGILRQNGAAPDDVVALTFSRRAQQHMEQTLDGLCVRVAHNHTFDGLWLRMANDFNRLQGKSAIRILGLEEVKDFLSSQIQQQMELWRQHGRCQFDLNADVWKDLLDTISELLCHYLQQGFVKHTKVGVYSMQQVWEQEPAQREIMAAFLSDSRIKYELGSSQLALSSRDVDIVVKKAIKALVHSLQEGDAIVWELLGHATCIWHIATQQLFCSEEPSLKAARRIFGYWSSRQAWLLDEFQDVAHAQYRLLYALTCNASSGRLCQRVTIVGDGDQAIYDWRGADVRLFEEQFEQDYTAVQRLAMITNYRSTSSIVAHSNALIACNYQHPGRGTCVPKALQAAPGTKDNRAVQFVRYSSKEAQGQHILDCVKSWHEYGIWHDRAGVQRGPGVPYSQIRILARARWQLFHLRGVLSRGGLKPHVVLAGDSALLEDAEDADPQIPSSDMAGNSSDKLVLSSVHAVKGLECVVCFVVGLDIKAWRYLPRASSGVDLQQTQESRNVAYVAMTRAERVLYLSHVGPAEAANSFFLEAMLPGDVVADI
ncbi:TPA: hypothetical protein ACH3X2_007212 [Trebouxia sp. C0005]